MDTPVYSPALPYLAPIHGGFRPGRMLRFQGVPHPSARCFAINLQCGGNTNPRDDVALHFSPVFSPPPRVVRNSLSGQTWGPEESHGSFFPFTPGQSCEILILAEASKFMIAINGEHFGEFYYRIPLDRVNYLGIDGEISVNMFKFEGTPVPYESPSYGAMPTSTPYAPMPTSTPYAPMPTSMPYAPMPTSQQTPYGPVPTSQPYQPYPTGAQPYNPAYQPQGQPYGAVAPPPGGQLYPTQQSYPHQGGQTGLYPGTSVAYPRSPGQHHKSSGLLAAAAGVGTALAGAAMLHKNPLGHKMHKKSSPIPIGLGLGAGALGAAALMGPLRPKKLKKLYKHKHFKHKHKWGWKGRSSSSSSD